MHSIAQGTDTNIFWSNQAWLACSEWRIVPIDSLIGPETYTPIEDLYFSTRGPRTLGALTQSRPASLLGLCERCNRSITINLRHRKDQRIDNNLTDTINYRHSSLDAAYYYQAQLLATQDNDGDLPFQCYLKAWMSKYSLPRYSHIPSIAYIQLVIFSLELLLDIWISSSLGRQDPLFGLGWNLLDGPFIGKRRRTRSQFELVQPTCHVLQGQHTHLCYSLVVGLAPLGSSLGWKDLFSLTRVAWGSV
jgi:hypothetical protein